MAYQLVLCARREKELQEAVSECVSNGADAIYAVADVTKREDVKAVLAKAAKEFGRIDILVNNAGKGSTVTPLNTTDADISEMMALNVNSAMYGMQEVIPYFEQAADNTYKAKGHIVNVSSLLGRLPLPNSVAISRAPYAGAKHFLCSFTDAYREEVTQKYGGGVTVSTLLPGPVATEFGANAGGIDSRRIEGVEEVDNVIATLIKECIVGRRWDVYTRDAYVDRVAAYHQHLLKQ